MTNKNRGAFTSSFGAMMAVAGSAVGLGNIWRFPFMAGVNGGAAFLILYLVFVLLVGLPLILSEFSIGRATHKGCVDSFRILRPGSRWFLSGYISMVVGFTIMGFYSVIAGWTLYFMVDAIANGFPTSVGSEVAINFNAFVASGWKPISYTLLFIVAVVWIVRKGVEKGIEKSSKILMPILIVLLVLMCINSFTLSGFGPAMDFLFKPDFSKITGQTVLDALGQVFFTLSIGMGVMITYSSYVTKQENMIKSKAIVTVIDTSIAIISGIAIFPAVFTYGISPQQGPELVFIALPTVFAQMSFGTILGVMFFILLLIAALTSAISIFEMLTAIFVEEYKMSRKKALYIIGGIVAMLGVLSALSQMPNSELRIFGFNFFDFLDMLSSNYLLTMGGLVIAIFTGWFFGREKLRKVFTSDGRYANALFRPFLFIIRYVSPVAVALIFLSKLGFI